MMSFLALTRFTAKAIALKSIINIIQPIAVAANGILAPNSARYISKNDTL